MTDGQQPEGAPDAPWNTPSPQAPQAPRARPGDQVPEHGPATPTPPREQRTQGGIVLPSGTGGQQQGQQQGQQPGQPGQPGAPQEQSQVKEVPEGPWNDMACHRSWLMGGQPVPVNVERPARINPHTQQVVDPGGTERQVHVVPMIPSPYACIGPKCTLWDAEREGCVEKLLMSAKLELAEQQVSLTNRARSEVAGVEAEAPA